MDENGSHGGLVIAGLSVLQGRVEEAGGIKRSISVSWSIFDNPKAMRFRLNVQNGAKLSIDTH